MRAGHEYRPILRQVLHWADAIGHARCRTVERTHAAPAQTFHAFTIRLETNRVIDDIDTLTIRLRADLSDEIDFAVSNDGFDAEIADDLLLCGISHRRQNASASK